MNFGSQSELFEQNSLSGIQVQEINSQIKNEISQFSHDSELKRNKSYLSKRDTTSQDKDCPFDGPKLHLYRKG